MGMNLRGIYTKLTKNHGLLMLICCVVPIILILISVNFFGLSEVYLVWSLLLLCPLMHFFMMKDMQHTHREHYDENIRLKTDQLNLKE